MEAGVIPARSRRCERKQAPPRATRVSSGKAEVLPRKSEDMPVYAAARVETGPGGRLIAVKTGRAVPIFRGCAARFRM